MKLFEKFSTYNEIIRGIQAQPIDPDLTAKLLGRGVAVSPVVTVEPRRRKFHKAITLSMPAPRAHSQGMINQYSGNAPTLRLLCSITGMYMIIYNVTQIIDNLIDNQLRQKKTIIRKLIMSFVWI